MVECITKFLIFLGLVTSVISLAWHIYNTIFKEN